MNQLFDEQLVWNVRLFIYNTTTITERPPTIAETAAHFAISAAHAERLFRELHQRHAIFLDPQTDTLRMANPYSTAPTRYRVLANGRAYWANCAWDAFGIPAMLDSDAQIHTNCANNDQPIAITSSAVNSSQSEAWFISRCRLSAGMRIWSLPEPRFCSSGRKRRSAPGVNGITWHGAKCSHWIRLGRWPKPCITIEWQPTTAGGASNKCSRSFEAWD